jgi:hypothetical protein
MKQRNSRWDDEPRLNAKGQPIIVYPSDGDFVVFKLLNRYRYLPLDFIVAHTGLSYSYLKHRLDLLARKPNKFLDRPEKQKSTQPNANYRFLTYELAFRGETQLKDKGLFSDEPLFGDEKFFSHSRMINETIINLEMGARLGGNEMIWFPEIATKLKEPHRFIPVSVSHQFPTGKKTAEFGYYNDSNGPFGVRYRNGHARFYSLEAEHTNQVDCNNLSKTSFLKKFLAVQHLMNHQLYKTVWGLPNLITLVVTPSQARIETMKELILRETGGKGATYIAFAVVPVIENIEPVPHPDPDLFNRPWQRAGHPDLFLSQPTAKKATA